MPTPDELSRVRPASWLERQAITVLIGLVLTGSAYIWGMKGNAEDAAALNQRLKTIEESLIRLEAKAAQWEREIERLRQENAELRREVAELRREVAELRRGR